VNFLLMKINSIDKLYYIFFTISILMLVLPFSAFAEEKQKNIQSSAVNTDISSASYLSQFVVGLIIVLLCILILAWLAKRFNGFQSLTGDSLQVLGGLSMGSRERLVLVKVGSEQLLLGVTPGQINTLHVLTQPISKPINPPDKILDMNLYESIASKLSRNKR